MNRDEVLTLLEENRNERGILHWEKLGEKTGGLEGFGIGLTQLRKMAKSIGRDRELALELWETNVYDAKILGLLLDEPKKLPREQAERQVEQLNGGMLAHVFASCDATLAKTPWAFELANDWMESDDPVRRRCAWGLLYELSKKKKVQGMDDDYLLGRIAHIRDNVHDEEMWVRESMMGALMAVGKRTRELNQAALEAARAIGPVDIDYGPDNACQPIDVVKHLTSDYLKKKLGL